jgi:hypothetical protein
VGGEQRPGRKPPPRQALLGIPVLATLVVVVAGLTLLYRQGRLGSDRSTGKKEPHRVSASSGRLQPPAIRRSWPKCWMGRWSPCQPANF